MNIIQARRGFGKTKVLIQESYETGKLIVCSSQKEKDYIMNFAADLSYDILAPVCVGGSIDEYDRAKIINSPGLLVDNVDLVLQVLFYGARIDTVTLTQD